jgi:hypothetical protein
MACSSTRLRTSIRTRCCRRGCIRGEGCRAGRARLDGGFV